MDRTETGQKIRELFVTNGHSSIFNLAVPAREEFSYSDVVRDGFEIVELKRRRYGNDPTFLFYDPKRRFTSGTSIECVAEKIALDTSKIAAIATSKTSCKEDPSYERAAMDIGRFLSAIGELDDYDVILGFGSEKWNEETASELDDLGIDIVYDDTKKLARFSKKHHSPNDIRVSIYHSDPDFPGRIRLLEQTKNSTAMCDYVEGTTSAYAIYQIIRHSHLILPQTACCDEVVAKLVSVFTMGQCSLDLAPYPDYAKHLTGWNRGGLDAFLASNTTLFSKPRKWGGKRWFKEIYPVFEAVIPLWREVLVAKTSGGRDKKSEANKELSKVLSGKYDLDSDEAKRAFDFLYEAGEESGAKHYLNAIKEGVPIEDVMA